MQVFYHICAIFLKLDTPRRVFQCPLLRVAFFLLRNQGVPSVQSVGHKYFMWVMFFFIIKIANSPAKLQKKLELRK